MAETVREGSGSGAGGGPDLERFRERIRSGNRGSDHGYVLLLGLEPADTARLVEQVEKGFSYRELEHLQDNVGLSRSDVADLVQVKPRTLDRRKKEGRLLPEESDRLLRVSRVFGKALELFEGDPKAAKEWLSAPQTALGGAVPLDMARTDIGAREVEALVGRLEHGVFS
jgi:putative toxin-antitoxin system antitoxin component (TIGR02293 family)